MCDKRKYHRKRKERKYLFQDAWRVLDTKAAGIELIASNEIFLLVPETCNYWISNYGRLVNNLRNGYYMHKSGGGNVHYTVTCYDAYGERYTRDWYTDTLVAEVYLKKVDKCSRVWHLDNDRGNNYYKNLMYVTDDEYIALNSGAITVENIQRKQEYIPYTTKSAGAAYDVWNSIYSRCYRDTRYKAYDGVTMCNKWRRNPDSFAKWYIKNYYECGDEPMVIDKDLLCPGNREYAPDKCCILPRTLNVMISNCKKHKLPASPYRKEKVNNLPLGVYKSSKKNKYEVRFTPCGGELITIGEFDTPEEAFQEYKRHKQADIISIADEYKNAIPPHIYEALLKIDVQPY